MGNKYPVRAKGRVGEKGTNNTVKWIVEENKQNTQAFGGCNDKRGGDTGFWGYLSRGDD